MAGILPARIPLFPLPGTILFPSVPLPLHIFEPRYRAMVGDALAGAGVIGMVLLRPGWESDYEGRPPIFSIGCAGLIVQHERLEDGRFNIVLLGQQKFQVVSEEHDRPYRLGTVKYLDDIISDSAAVKQLRGEALIKINQLARASGAAEDLLSAASAAAIPDHEFVNFLCQMLSLSPIEKQALLEEEGTEARFAKLIDILEFLRLGAGKNNGAVQ